MSAATRAITVAASLLFFGGVASFFKAQDNLKPIALNIILMSATAIATNEAMSIFADGEKDIKIKSLQEEISEISRKKHDAEKKNNQLNADLESYQEAVNKLSQELVGSNNAVGILQQRLKKFEEDYTAATKKLESGYALKMKQLEAKLSKDDEQVKDFLIKFRDKLLEKLGEKVFHSYKQISNTAERYLDSETQQIYLPKLENSFDVCKQKLERLEKLDLDKILSDGIAIIFGINLQISTARIDLRKHFHEKVEIERDATRHLLKDKEARLQALREYKKESDDMHSASQEKLQQFLAEIGETKNSYEEMQDQVYDLLQELEAKNLKLDQLNNLVEELKKPIQFSEGGEYAGIGNAISTFYDKNYGYRLDCFNWREIPTGYQIIFAVRNNQGLTIDKLYIKNSREQLAEFTKALVGTLPEFELDYQQGIATLTVQQRKPVKKELDAVDIFRECDVIRALKFGAVIQQHHIDKGGLPTLRVMTATGGGKGIAVKNLVDYYTKNVDGYEIWLSDPMDGSNEDYWDCPKVATNEDSAQELFNKFATVYRGRHTKTSTDPKTPILGIFDEFDKNHSKEDKKTASEIWTAIRHQNMRLILVGQCAEVGKNGWTWQDMDNCGLLFIGKAITTFIKHADKDLGMSSEALEKFSARYNKIKKWIETKNEEIEEVENHYRIAALYVSGKAMLLEIPYALKAPITSGKSWLVSKPFEQQTSINTQNHLILTSSNWVEIKPHVEVLATKIACPKCKSESVKKNGKDKATGTIQLYKCNDCGKGFSEKEILTNSN